MSNRWVIDDEYPKGRLVPMTAAEQAQLDADQSVGLAARVADDAKDSNRASVVAAIGSRMATLRQARSALAGGSIFAGLSAKERGVIDLLLQDDLQFGRLALQLFDATDA